jgi:signal transduction histidine kinase
MPSQFQSLHWRLLMSYLGVMAAILGVSAIAVYQLFVHSLYQQLDSRLLTLAGVAAQNFTTIKHQYHELHESQAEKQGEEHQKHDAADGADDNDGDLDIPLQMLRLDEGAEWFDRSGQLLEKRGSLFPADPVISTRHLGHSKTLAAERIRSLVLTVYEQDSKGDKQDLAGYVRLSESTAAIEAVLERVRLGLGLGSLIALGLTAVGGMWLTRQSLQPIERSFRQLQQFTADASHELRSPLTAIKTSIEVMQSHPERIHPADVKKVAAIASASDQLTHLVEDLLLLARMDMPTIQPVWESVSLPELLTELCDRFEIQAEEREIVLKADLQSQVDVLGDRSQLVRLFSNLLQNALQYTAAGGKITLTLARKEQVALITVEDNGIGIAPEDIPFVFDRFWRADQARSHRQGGLGMGLAIAQSIAQTHSGDIAVSSQMGRGTCFRVRLPIKT